LKKRYADGYKWREKERERQMDIRGERLTKREIDKN
jgi:hypothetical protein